MIAKKENIIIKRELRKHRRPLTDRIMSWNYVHLQWTIKNKCKKESLVAEDNKKPSEAGMTCTIDGDTFFCS